MIGKGRGGSPPKRGDGLLDEPGPEASRRIGDDERERVITKTVQERPARGHGLVVVRRLIATRVALAMDWVSPRATHGDPVATPGCGAGTTTGTIST